MSGTNSKSIFISKTFWINAVALLAMIIQGIIGKEVLSLEMQGVALSVINILLRTITKSAVDWN